MTDAYRLACRTYRTPKAGHTAEEYEDAFAAAPERGRFAIADGASESALAGAWARLLGNAFVQTPGPWSGWLSDARKRWDVEVQKRELPWYAETKFQEGAYAAMLGIAFTPGHWSADAVGDCCLFQVRGGRLLRAFPMRNSSDFGNRPSLLGSRRRLPEQARTLRLHYEGDFCPADIFFLMTDALAEWFLRTVEEGQQPWRNLQAVVTEGQFVPYIDKLRETKALRNDDVTLMLIRSSRTMIQPLDS